ncbi:putative terminal uridylyltransferase [Paratrimastix pyriformis]|uniref:Terminal uridylyltransferase n=1 Tax=Paratrimastix pyriformis TaxID=342808 RepID=A0ABQ8UF26_9EUKA|nr:putative terminal uridylyltransferase [Paratrimastix pyriformis]
MAESFFSDLLRQITPTRATRESQRTFLDELSCIIRRALRPAQTDSPDRFRGRGRGGRGGRGRGRGGNIPPPPPVESGPVPTCHLFGSAATDTDLATAGFSDLDVTVNYGKIELDGQPLQYSEQLAKLSRACPFDRNSLIDMIVKEFEGAAFSSMSSTSSALLGGSMSLRPGGFDKPTLFRVTQMLPHARVPLISVTHDIFKVSSDITFSQLYPLLNTDWLRTRLDEPWLSPWIRPLIRLVKYWARRRGIPSAKLGGLSSYTWTLLVLFLATLHRDDLLPFLHPVTLPAESPPPALLTSRDSGPLPIFGNYLGYSGLPPPPRSARRHCLGEVDRVLYPMSRTPSRITCRCARYGSCGLGEWRQYSNGGVQSLGPSPTLDDDQADPDAVRTDQASATQLAATLGADGGRRHHPGDVDEFVTDEDEDPDRLRDLAPLTLAIEDPIETWRDLGRSLSALTARRLRAEVQRAVALLQEVVDCDHKYQTALRQGRTEGVTHPGDILRRLFESTTETREHAKGMAGIVPQVKSTEPTPPAKKAEEEEEPGREKRSRRDDEATDGVAVKKETVSDDGGGAALFSEYADDGDDGDEKL